ncbi:DUF4129 domain-containing protein [Microbacteriaceae bacterium VKM Ac-2855]|nr:DUF4129 domain-containing protein [Microbacteriaceae bacterium VKM Ac-2855]
MSVLALTSTTWSDPDAEQARRLLQNELSDPRYQAAKPTWFDLLARAVRDWFTSLSAPSGDGGASVAAIVGVVVVAAIVIAVLLVTGVPRLQRRSALRGAVLDVDDQRSADAIRSAASAAAAAGDWDTAVEEAFRAIARALAERTVVIASPGTTAHGVAERAAASFAAEADGLRAAADDFDRVRYLGSHGDRAAYERVRALDQRLAAARPSSAGSVAGVAAL